MIIRSQREFECLLKEIEQVDRWAYDTEGIIGIFPDQWHLTGTSISLDGKTGYYIPSGHEEGSGQLPAEYVIEQLKPHMQNPDKMLYGANLKHDMKVFRLIDPTFQFLPDNVFCTMTASFILDTNNKHGLKETAQRELNHTMQTLTDIGCPVKKDPRTGDKMFYTNKMSIDGLAPYAIDDAIQTFRLGDIFRERIEKQGYSKVYYELEMPFMFILLELEESGIKLDKDRLTTLMEEAPQTLQALDDEIQTQLPVDDHVNINSNVQLSPILFGKLGIRPRGQKTQTGKWSIKNEYLELWAVDNPVCGKISEYKKLKKLFGNYLSNLYYRLGKDGRLHGSFNRHIARTGRLSSSTPNLQNIPRLENDIYGIRKLFMANEGCTLICADFSQIELRMEAHLSQDKALIQAFQSGADVHSATAKNVFKLNCNVDEVKDKHPIKRSIAKALNFGIIYEAGAKTLAMTANKGIKEEADYVTESFMSQVMADYFKQYPGVKRFIEVCHQKAIKNGYIQTITGRKRYIPNAQLPPTTKDANRLRYAAFRQASNTPAQGGAADVLAIAMRNIYNRLIEEDIKQYTKFVLQVHDELVVEVKEAYVDQVATIVKEEMENAVSLRVPLVADIQIGKVWGDLK